MYMRILFSLFWVLIMSITDTYKFGDLLGKGGFGAVYNGLRKEENKEVIIKAVEKRNRGRDYLNEVYFLQKLKHLDIIVQIIEHFQALDMIYIVFEKTDGMMDLFDFICLHGRLTEMTAKIIFKQVLDATLVCVNEGVLHGDLKDENILIHKENLQIKLIDFGTSLHIKKGFYTEYEGTNIYAPPEWKLKRKFTADGLNAWSLGVILYTMLQGDIPYDESENMWKLSLKWAVSKDATDLLKKLLKKNYKKRIALAKIKCQRWVKQDM